MPDIQPTGTMDGSGKVVHSVEAATKPEEITVGFFGGNNVETAKNKVLQTADGQTMFVNNKGWNYIMDHPDAFQDTLKPGQIDIMQKIGRQ